MFEHFLFQKQRNVQLVSLINIDFIQTGQNTFLFYSEVYRRPPQKKEVKDDPLTVGKIIINEKCKFGELNESHF